MCGDLRCHEIKPAACLALTMSAPRTRLRVRIPDGTVQSTRQRRTTESARAERRCTRSQSKRSAHTPGSTGAAPTPARRSSKTPRRKTPRRRSTTPRSSSRRRTRRRRGGRVDYSSLATRGFNSPAAATAALRFPDPPAILPRQRQPSGVWKKLLGRIKGQISSIRYCNAYIGNSTPT